MHGGDATFELVASFSNYVHSSFLPDVVHHSVLYQYHSLIWNHCSNVTSVSLNASNSLFSIKIIPAYQFHHFISYPHGLWNFQILKQKLIQVLHFLSLSRLIHWFIAFVQIYSRHLVVIGWRWRMMIALVLIFGVYYSN